MTQQHSFTVSSALAISAHRFWTDSTLADVNAELAPWVRMTAPKAWRRKPLRLWPCGKPLFRSWILLFGLVPVDIHQFYMKAMHLQGGFDEQSTSLTNRYWHHTRVVAPRDDGCQVTDEVRFASRLPLLGELLLPIYHGIFRSRHRVLRRKYGERID